MSGGCARAHSVRGSVRDGASRRAAGAHVSWIVPWMANCQRSGLGLGRRLLRAHHAASKILQLHTCTLHV